MSRNSPLSPVQPGDDPKEHCPKHHNTYNPYSSECWPCKREKIHLRAREEWSEICQEQAFIDLEIPDGEPLPPQEEFPIDALVEWQGQSHILSINEIDSEQPAKRFFTIDGGFPIDWIEDDLRLALAEKLGLRTMSVVEFKRDAATTTLK
jgi:hypothetical protein